MTENAKDLKSQGGFLEPQVIAQFSPSEVKNLIATCGKKYTFYLTESSVVFRINEEFETPTEIKDPIEYVLNIPREITTGATFITVNCDATRILILTKTSIFLYKFNPKALFHEVEMLHSIELNFQPASGKVVDVCFFEDDPNYFAIAYHNGFIQFINCTTGYADDEIYIRDKIVSIKFGPRLEKQYLHLSLYVFTGEVIYAINPLLTPNFRFTNHFIDQIKDEPMKNLLESIKNNGLYDFFIPPPIKIVVNTQISSFDFLEDYFAFIIPVSKQSESAVVFVQNEFEPKLLPISKPKPKDLDKIEEIDEEQKKAEELRAQDEESKRSLESSPSKKHRPVGQMTLQRLSLSLFSTPQVRSGTSDESPPAIIKWEGNIMKIDITDSVIGVPLGIYSQNVTFMRNPGLIAFAPNTAVFFWGKWKEDENQRRRLISAGGRVAFYGSNAIGFGGNLCLLSPGYVLPTTPFENGSTRANPGAEVDGRHGYEQVNGAFTRNLLAEQVKNCTTSFQENRKLIDELNKIAAEREKLHRQIGEDKDLLRWDDLLTKSKALRKKLMRMRAKLKPE